MKNIILITLTVFTSILNSQNLIWMKTMTFSSPHPGTMTSDVTNIETDNQGNIFATGNYEIQSNIYYVYAYLSKIDPAGNEIWKDTTSDDGGTRSLTSSQNYLYSGGGVYVRKYDYNGNLIWGNRGLANATNTIGADDMVLYNNFLYVVFKDMLYKYDTLGNVIWSKQINLYGSLQIEKANPGYFFIKAGDGNNYNPVSIIKYDSSGNTIWTKPVPGILNFDGNISSDQNGDCFLTGFYQGNAAFGSILLTCKVCTLDYYIAKLTPNGTWAWAKNIQNVRNFYLYSDPSNNYLFTGEVDGNSSTVLTIYDKQGNYLKGISISGPNDVYAARDIKIFGKTIYVAGFKTGQYIKAFLARIDDNTLTAITPEKKTVAACNLSVFPNPSNRNFTINFNSTLKGRLVINVKNELGQNIYTDSKSSFSGEYDYTIDLSRQTKGVYFIDAILGDERRTKKIILE